MATWTDESKILFIWNSGIQYIKEIKLESIPTNLNELIKTSYSNKKLIDESEDSIVFIGGNKTVNNYSWILPITEKYLYHKITIDLPNNGNLVLKVSYDAKCYFNIIIGSTSYQREIKELETHLKKT